jgi:hypothetical protein
MDWENRAPRAYLRALAQRTSNTEEARVSHWFSQHYPALEGLVAACKLPTSEPR